MWLQGLKSYSRAWGRHIGGEWVLAYGSQVETGCCCPQETWGWLALVWRQSWRKGSSWTFCREWLLWEVSRLAVIHHEQCGYSLHSCTWSEKAMKWCPSSLNTVNTLGVGSHRGHDHMMPDFLQWVQRISLLTEFSFFFSRISEA